jgi:HEPN domain-containing protein
MPDRYPPDDPREWLNRAHSNIALAKSAHSTTVYLEDLCYNAQQAAEKAIKSVCIHHQIPYPYIHDLAALITILIQNGIPVPEEVQESAKLTRYAIMTRYPHPRSIVNDREYQRAITIAETVIFWCEGEIKAQKKP